MTRFNHMPRVSIQDTNQVFEVKEGDVVYDALSDKGYQLPHGCLSGSCGACRIEIIQGADNLVPPGVIEQNTVDALKEEPAMKGKFLRLSCRAKVQGDIVIRPAK